MKALAIVALLGCGAVQRHPFVASAAANTALVIGAGICESECGSPESGVSKGVLIGEIALSSLVALVGLEGIISYASESH